MPSDRRATALAELEPVFAALADVQETAEMIRRTARDRAARLRVDADRRADAVTADARAASGTERADTAEQVRRDAQADLAAVLSDAERTAAQVRRLGRQWVPRLREEVVGLVRAELAMGPGAKGAAA